MGLWIQSNLLAGLGIKPTSTTVQAKSYGWEVIISGQGVPCGQKGTITKVWELRCHSGKPALHFSIIYMDDRLNGNNHCYIVFVHTQGNPFLTAPHGTFPIVLPELARNLFLTQVSFARVLTKCGQPGRDTVTGKTNSKCSWERAHTVGTKVPLLENFNYLLLHLGEISQVLRLSTGESFLSLECGLTAPGLQELLAAEIDKYRMISLICRLIYFTYI